MQSIEGLRQALADRYRVDRELGAGGMATVYLAHDVKHERPVAIKVLRDDLTASLGAERFIREISVAAGLTHPHILPLHDSGEAGGRLFYVMPFVDGQSLRQKLGKTGELPIPDAVRILRDVADAMAYAHRRGVVHRDLKPENIMLSERHALVTDFGVAKALSEATGRQTLTTAGVALGTPSYMSPEQATADPHADHRSDIYSFGVLAYELLTGQTPFSGRSPQEVLAAHVTSPVVPVTSHRATIPSPLAVMVMQCLEKKPADRPQSADELLPVLEALMTPSGGSTPVGTAPYAGMPAPRAARRSRVIAGAAALIVLVAVGYAVWRTIASPRATGTRVVVAWLDNRTGDTSVTQIGSLAAEWISGGLAREGTTTVIPASVVRELMSGELKSSTSPVAELVRRTAATVVITGRIDRRGDSLEYRVEARDLAADNVIATVGPVVGGRESTSAFDRLAEQVLIALDLRRQWGTKAQWQRPASLAAYREYMTGVNDYFVRGQQRASIPFMERAIALDSMWLSPRITLLAVYGNAGDYVRADSVRAASQQARAAAPTLDQLNFDWVAVRHDGDYEAQYRIGKRMFDLDPSNTYTVTLPAARTGRAREVLKYAALADTTLYMTREWRGNYWTEFWAHHARRDYETELAAARKAVERLGLDITTAGYVVRPLAAMKRYGEVDSLYALARGLPNRGTATAAGLLTIASGEYLAHGGDAEQARRLQEQRLDYYRQLPDSQRARYTVARLDAAMRTGDLARARTGFDSLAQLQPENINYLGPLGAVAALQGDAAMARAVDGRLAAISRPHLFEWHTLWRGRIAALLGDCSMAEAHLRTALRSQNYSDDGHHWWAALGRARECKNLLEVLNPRD